MNRAGPGQSIIQPRANTVPDTQALAGASRPAKKRAKASCTLQDGCGAENALIPLGSGKTRRRSLGRHSTSACHGKKTAWLAWQGCGQAAPPAVSPCGEKRLFVATKTRRGPWGGAVGHILLLARADLRSILLRAGLQRDQVGSGYGGGGDRVAARPAVMRHSVGAGRGRC